jgi:hypothetical protein
MSRSFAKPCYLCGAPVRVSKREWKWTRKYVGSDNPIVGKAACFSCQRARNEQVFYPYGVFGPGGRVPAEVV